MMHLSFLRKRLFCPGPTPIPLSVQLTPFLTDPIHHREKTFSKIFRSCRALLAEVLQSSTMPILLTGSGTAAMEAVSARLVTKGDAVFVINGGKFGERWTEILTQLGCEVTDHQIPWGQAPDPEEIALCLGKKSYKAIFFQGNETSTGVTYPVQILCAALKKVSSALIVVDCISSLLIEPLLFDEWKIDALVGASQKGFGLPSGLSFVCLSERAWKSPAPDQRFYLDLQRERLEQEKGYTAWTPAIDLIQMLEASLKQITQITLPVFQAHHLAVAHAVRLSLREMGLDLFAKDHFSNAVTSVCCPPGIKSTPFTEFLETQTKMVFAKGQGDYQEKIFRMAHMGFVDPFDILSAIGALELALKHFGFCKNVGLGVSCFLRKVAYHQNG